MNSFVNQPLLPRWKQFLSCLESLEVYLLHMNVPINHHFCITGREGEREREREREREVGGRRRERGREGEGEGEKKGEGRGEGD